MKLFNPPSSRETTQFYDDLMDGTEVRGILGKGQRFNSLRILEKPSVRRYFLHIIRKYVDKNDVILDLGCGPGAFLAAVAPLCRQIVGVDISNRFTQSCRHLISHQQLTNAQAVHIGTAGLPFADDSFDVLLMVDVIHHLENRAAALQEALRVLKPGGRLLVYEPNKLSPVVAFLHLVDRNEWGLLRLGTPWAYRRVLKPYFDLERIDFNGIVIGPESRVFDFFAGIFDHPWLTPLLGWLNPKMFITGRKPKPTRP